MSLHTPFPRPPVPASPDDAFVSVTMRLAEPRSDLLVRHVRILRDCVALAQKRWAFEVEAAVVLPSEMQLLCVFPCGEFGVGGALQLISSAFAKHVPVPPMTGNLWSDCSEVIEIQPAVAELRRGFIEQAPVRAGLVLVASDWPFSSVHKKAQQAGDTGVAVA
ncbi:hypothetical protein Q4555_05780 [Octadecabacter sp. 1_MG-2023]|uniref:hypothetical protein n=1 Tax=unclassified Octadecabacter TaxID=196158 RepID=UPI0020910074|nr:MULTISPECIES: hypothetical protein [unclassified Octadecabacter]MDO6734168.1 hypothetical protein [Octadecabacter sp. 1_MG-2023]